MSTCIAEVFEISPYFFLARKISFLSITEAINYVREKNIFVQVQIFVNPFLSFPHEAHSFTEEAGHFLVNTC